MKKIMIALGLCASFNFSFGQLAVVDPAVSAGITALQVSVTTELTTANAALSTANGTLSSVSASSAKSSTSLASVVARQNEIRLQLRNPAAIAKFDIALKLVQMISNIQCTQVNLPRLLKKTNALNFCGFSLKYNTVSVQLGSAAQFLTMALGVGEHTSSERAQNLKTAFEYFQHAAFNYLALTNLLKKQVEETERINNRKKDYSAIIDRAF